MISSCIARTVSTTGVSNETGWGGKSAEGSEMAVGRRPLRGEFQDCAAGGVLGFEEAPAFAPGFFVFAPRPKCGGERRFKEKGSGGGFWV